MYLESGYVGTKVIDKVLLNASIKAMQMALEKIRFKKFEHILVDSNRFKPFKI
ncbi:MAG: hypothetical protein R2852_08590 [Bacteroidia bacterium]